MGVFDTYNSVRYGNQRISENYLRKMGFKKYKNWGAPHRWGPGSVFWEKIIVQEKDGVFCSDSASLWYFPDTFTGYVAQYGFKSSNKILGIINGIGTDADYYGDAVCKNDIQFAIDKMTHTLNEYNYL